MGVQVVERAAGRDGEFDGNVGAFPWHVAQQTRLRLAQDALSGTWEALLDRRVDLLVGAPGDGPAGGGYISQPIGMLDFVFAVAPTHPLAQLPGPLSRGINMPPEMSSCS